MTPSDELALIKQHVRRIEEDLAHTRQQIAGFEQRLPSAAPATRAAPLLAAAVPSTVAYVEPPPLPPPLPATPPTHAVTAPPSFPLPPRQAKEFVPAETPIEEPSPWRDWLTRLQLWPPAGEGDAEVRLGAWWATRLGAFLAVIGVVLFGVYVSVNTPAWVKFAELLSISAAVAGVGLWLERKIPRFGAVVFAAGLALLYFCAFAGYAVPPVKVIGTVAAASVWQLAAVALLVSAAVLRRSPTIATMAVGFGYVTAIFSRSGGMNEFALCTAALLAVASVGFHRLLRWEAPSVLALPGSYVVYAFVLQGAWIGAGAADSLWAWGFLIGFALLFFARDWRATGDIGRTSAGERWFQGLNAGLALLLGVTLALTLYRPYLAWFYFGAAAILALMATARRRQVENDGVAAVLLAKATGALTLGVIEITDARTTAIALLVQAWVLLFTARFLRSTLMTVATALVAGIAYAFFVADALMSSSFASLKAAGDVGFVVGFALLVSESVARLTASVERRLVEGVGALLAFAAGWLSVVQWQPSAWLASWALAMAVALGAAGAVRRAWSPMGAAGLLLIGANLAIWKAAIATPNASHLWQNTGVVVPVMIALGAWAPGGFARWTGELASRLARTLATGLWAMATVGVVLVMFNAGEPLTNVLAVFVLALGMGVSSPYLKDRRMPWLAVLAVAVGLACWVGRGAVDASTETLLALIVVAWALPVVMRASTRHRAACSNESQGHVIEPLLVAAATFVTVCTLPWVFAPEYRVAFFALAALVVAFLQTKPGIPSALLSSWVVWAMVGLASLELMGPTLTWSLRLGLGGALVLAWLPVLHLARRSNDESELPVWQRHGATIQSVIAVLLSLLLCDVGWDGAGHLVALLASALLAVGIHRFVRVPAARVGAVVLCGWTWAQAVTLSRSGAADGFSSGAGAVVLTATALAALPWWVGANAQTDAATERRRLSWITGGAALALVFLWSSVQRGVLAPYATVSWGAGAIVLFAAGLFSRLRPYRLIGLVGLLVCIPRVFFVDLQSAFHRIIAFVVLGVVLLWVGFSYHRFRHLIVDTREEPS